MSQDNGKAVVTLAEEAVLALRLLRYLEAIRAEDELIRFMRRIWKRLEKAARGEGGK